MGYIEFKPDKLSPAEDGLFILKRLVEFRENTDILVKEIVDQENQLVLSHFETDLSELREYLDAKRAGKELRPVVHAHWEWDENGMDWNIGAWKCSACKRKPETWWNTQKFYPSRCAGSHFCGNCGAIMDEEVPR